MPERIPLSWAALYATALAMVQLWQGTDGRFVALHFVFIVLWIFTFNIAGGFNRIRGAYVFWYGLLTVLVGTFIKALIGDPGDSNTWTPVLTMLLYDVSMVMLLASVIVTDRLIGRRRSVAEKLTAMRPVRYREATIGLFALMIVLQFGYYFLPLKLYGALHLMDQTSPLVVIVGTIYVIQSSGYRRTMGVANAVPMAYSFYMALGGFSKLGMFLPFASWMLAVAYTRFRLRFVHLVMIPVVGWLCVYALTPLAQVGRTVVPDNLSGTGRSNFAIHMLINLKETRAQYEQSSSDAFTASSEYYSKNISDLWSRMTMFPPDDRLISYTSRGNYIGWAGVKYDLINLIPHIILPNKDIYATEMSMGNYFAREIGLLPPRDTSTGISFSPMAECFHIAGWFAVLVFLPVLWVVFLGSLEFVCGDLRATPWGLIFALFLSHVAPESGVSGLINFITVGNAGMIFTVLLSAFVAPVIGNLFVREPAPAPPMGLPAAI